MSNLYFMPYSTNYPSPDRSFPLLRARTCLYQTTTWSRKGCLCWFDPKLHWADKTGVSSRRHQFTVQLASSPLSMEGTSWISICSALPLFKSLHPTSSPNSWGGLICCQQSSICTLSEDRIALTLFPMFL